MIRPLLRASAAIAFALLLTPAAPSAAPAPGLAYDEVVRVVVNATPPPPGNFQGDLAAVNSATPVPAPAARKRGIGIGAIAGAVIGGGGAGSIAGSVASDVASNAVENALQAQLGASFGALTASIRGFLQPRSMHYAYYNGWERVDDVAAQTATIRKCDIGQVVHLDLAKRTYSLYDPNSEPASTPAAPAPRGARGAATSAGAPAPPGTAVADFSATTKSLGPLRIESQTTNGFDSTAAFTLSQSTGSCHDANAAVRTVEYLSPLGRPPVTSCPIRRAPLPETASDLAAPPAPSGGCRPTLTFHHSGPAIPAGKLALYALVTMTGGAGASAPAGAAPAGSVGFLTERGNLKTLAAGDAALFEIPAGFTKTP